MPPGRVRKAEDLVAMRAFAVHPRDDVELRQAVVGDLPGRQGLGDHADDAPPAPRAASARIPISPTRPPP